MGDVISLRPGLEGGSWGAEQRAIGAGSGEDEAARLVFLVHEPALVRRALRLARLPDAAWLVSDTFELFLRHRDGIGSAASLVVWLYTAMYDLYVTRSQQRRALRVVRVEASGPQLPPPQPPAWARVTRAQFAAAVAALPPELRWVFELHEVDGLSYAEIGARLQLGSLAVFARLFRARLLLKDMLRDLQGEEGRGHDVGV
jgi:RNA polymerase sigma-70 factor (ECF subfamily)